MSVLKAFFDNTANQCSPVQDDYRRVVSHDEDGNEFITYEKVDLASFQESLGLVDNWSLETLLKAGIDPNFPIHTGFNTRLDGLDTLNSAVEALDSIMAEENNNDDKTE